MQKEDKLWLEIIEAGKNQYLDMMIEGLQEIVKQEGGVLSNYCRVGGETGMTITRSAFAILIKYAGLYEAL